MFSAGTMLTVLLAVLALFGTGYGLGKHHADNACLARQKTADTKQQTKAVAEVVRREAVGAAREVSRESIRVVYRTIKEKADDNIKKNAVAALVAPHKSPPAPLLQRGGSEAEGDFVACGLDADGLRVWNAANSGDASGLSGEPDYALPAPAPGRIGGVGGFGLKPHRSDGAVRAVPGPAGEAGGM